MRRVLILLNLFFMSVFSYSQPSLSLNSLTQVAEEGETIASGKIVFSNFSGFISGSYSKFKGFSTTEEIKIENAQTQNDESQAIFALENWYIRYSNNSKPKLPVRIQNLMAGTFSMSKIYSRLKNPCFTTADVFKFPSVSTTDINFSLPTISSSADDISFFCKLQFDIKNPFYFSFLYSDFLTNDSFSGFLTIPFTFAVFSQNITATYSLCACLYPISTNNESSWWLSTPKYESKKIVASVQELCLSGKLWKTFTSIGISQTPFNSISVFCRNEFTIKTSIKNPSFLLNGAIFVTDGNYFTISSTETKELFCGYLNPQFLVIAKNLQIRFGLLSELTLSEETEKSLSKDWNDISKAGIEIKYSKLTGSTKWSFKNCFSDDIFSYTGNLKLILRSNFEESIFKFYTCYITLESSPQKTNNIPTWNVQLKGNWYFSKVSLSASVLTVVKTEIYSFEASIKAQFNHFVISGNATIPQNDESSSRSKKISLLLSWKI